MNDEDSIDSGLRYPPKRAFRYLNSLAFDCDNGYWDLAGLYAQRRLWQAALAIYEAIKAPTAETARAWLARISVSREWMLNENRPAVNGRGYQTTPGQPGWWGCERLVASQSCSRGVAA